MFKKILIVLLLMMLCDRCRGFIDEERGYYVCENAYEHQTHQRLDKNICKNCYRLLPIYIQDNYKKVNKTKEKI